MAFLYSDGIGIAGIACAVPDNEVTVESFIPVFGEEIPAKFTAGTGIRSMYKALPEQTAGDLAYVAAENLFSRLKVDRRKLGRYYSLHNRRTIADRRPHVFSSIDLG